MKTLTGASVALLMVECVCFALPTGVTIVSQTRYVSVSNNKGYGDSKSAFDFGQFNQSAGSTPWNGYSVTASQNSIILSDGITAQGATHGGGPFQYPYSESYSENSSSSFAVGFAIDTACEMVLTGKLHISADVGGTNYEIPDARVSLAGQSEVIFSLDIQYLLMRYGSGDYEQQLNETFFLYPGQYTLSAYASTDGDYSRDGTYPGVGGGGWASYDIALTPEPATVMLLGLGVVVVMMNGFKFKKQ